MFIVTIDIWMCYTGTEQYVNIFTTYTVYYINIEVLTFQAVLYSEVGFVKKKKNS